LPNSYVHKLIALLTGDLHRHSKKTEGDNNSNEYTSIEDQTEGQDSSNQADENPGKMPWLYTLRFSNILLSLALSYFFAVKNRASLSKLDQKIVSPKVVDFPWALNKDIVAFQAFSCSLIVNLFLNARTTELPGQNLLEEKILHENIKSYSHLATNLLTLPFSLPLVIVFVRPLLDEEQPWLIYAAAFARLFQFNTGFQRLDKKFFTEIRDAFDRCESLLDQFGFVVTGILCFSLTSYMGYKNANFVTQKEQQNFFDNTINFIAATPWLNITSRVLAASGYAITFGKIAFKGCILIYRHLNYFLRNQQGVVPITVIFALFTAGSNLTDLLATEGKSTENNQGVAMMELFLTQAINYSSSLIIVSQFIKIGESFLSQVKSKFCDIIQENSIADEGNINESSNQDSDVALRPIMSFASLSTLILFVDLPGVLLPVAALYLLSYACSCCLEKIEVANNWNLPFHS
jgi:hypothetical protein